MVIREPPRVGPTIQVSLPENLRPPPSADTRHAVVLRCVSLAVLHVRTFSIPVIVSPAIQVSGTSYVRQPPRAECGSVTCTPVRAGIIFWDGVAVMPIWWPLGC